MMISKPLIVFFTIIQFCVLNGAFSRHIGLPTKRKYGRKPGRRIVLMKARKIIEGSTVPTITPTHMNSTSSKAPKQKSSQMPKSSKVPKSSTAPKSSKVPKNKKAGTPAPTPKETEDGDSTKVDNKVAKNGVYMRRDSFVTFVAGQMMLALVWSSL